jgi:glutamate synthase (NADPH/NADH) small chain
MKASEKERQWAQLNGVTIRLWAAPLRFEQHNQPTDRRDVQRGAAG